MRRLVRRLWNGLTRFRHRSELLALRIAVRLPFAAIIPIGLVCCFWWYVWCLPFVPPLVIFANIPGTTGTVLTFALVLPLLAMLFFAGPWFINWCLTAVTMTFGNMTRAEAMERYLHERLHLAARE